MSQLSLPFDLTDVTPAVKSGWVKIIITDGPDNTVKITVKSSNPSPRVLDAAALLTSKIEESE